jgi:hypothetical protein
MSVHRMLRKHIVGLWSSTLKEAAPRRGRHSTAAAALDLAASHLRHPQLEGWHGRVVDTRERRA